jgi:Uma2 family endonuclease
VGAWADANPPAFLGLSPLDVRLSPGRIVQPDLFVLLGGLPSFEGPIDAVPELVIEVLSGDRGYDRVTKRVIYALAGVREYWIVDPLRRRVEVCQGIDHEEVFSGAAVSRVAKGLRVEIDAVFLE